MEKVNDVVVIELGDIVEETKGGGIVNFDVQGLPTLAAGLSDD